MSNMSDQAKQDHLPSHGPPVGDGRGVIGGNNSMGHNLSISDNQTTSNGSHSSRSKPQACKVCGKMLSSASSYYVHMKLHSGTKPYRCGVIIALKYS